LSIGVYNADLDPDGHEARRIVAYIRETGREGSVGT
jgi:hypothetical protein